MPLEHEGKRKRITIYGFTIGSLFVYNQIISWQNGTDKKEFIMRRKY